MLQIRKEQWDVFAEIEEKKFRGRLKARLTGKYGEYFDEAGLEQIDRFIEEGLGRARDYGLKDSKDILAFFVLMLTVSESFDSHEAIKSVLSDQTLPATRRMEKVLYETPSEVWDGLKGR